MSHTSRPRILIADDNMLIAEAFKKYLADSFDVVATVHNGRSLVEAASRLLPDVIIAEIAMPLLNGLEAGQRIKRLLPGVRIIYLTMNDEPEIVFEGFRHGGSGCLLKTSPASEIISAIRCVMRGGRYVSPGIPMWTTDPAPPSQNSGLHGGDLTERQREVLQLLAEGFSMKEAAAILNVATRTVAFHKYRIMESLQLQNNADMVQYAMRNHIVSN